VKMWQIAFGLLANLLFLAGIVVLIGSSTTISPEAAIGSQLAVGGIGVGYSVIIWTVILG